MPLWNDGSCRWCCVDRQFTYSDTDSLIASVVEHFATSDRPPEQLRYRAGKARIYAE